MDKLTTDEADDQGSTGFERTPPPPEAGAVEEALRKALIRLMSKVQIQHGTDRLGEAWDYAVEVLAGSVSAAIPEGLSGIRRDVLEAARIQFKAMAWQFHATRIGHDGDYSKCENAVCDENRKLIAALASSPSAPVEKAKPVPCGFPDRHFNASFPDSCPECPPPPKDPQ